MDPEKQAEDARKGKPAEAKLESSYLLRERVNNKTHNDSGDQGNSTTSRWQRFLASRPKLVEPAYLIYNMAERSSTIAHTEFVNHLVEEATLEAENLTEVTDELEDDIQSEASVWLLYCNLARTLPAIFVTLIVVAYGDVGGRRPGLLLSNVGAIARFTVYIIVLYEDLDVSWLVFGCFLDGLCGTHSVIMASVYSYISDVVTGPEHRKTFRFAVANSLLFLGAVVGNLTVGFIIDLAGFLPLFWIFTILYIVDFLYIAILVPESNPHVGGADFSIQGAFVKTIDAFQLYTKKRPEQPTATLSLKVLLAAVTIVSIVALGAFEVIVLYIVGEPFNLDSVDVGYFSALYAALSFLYAVIGVRALRRAGFADVGVAIISVIGSAAGLVFLGLAVDTVMLFLNPLLGGTAGMTIPVILVMMSKLVDPAEQGALMGSIHSVFTANELVATITLDAIYGATVDTFAGAVFFFMTGLYAIVLALLVFVLGLQRGWWLKSSSEEVTLMKDI